jgi:dipeptidyl aminopeptidase/acylaminoacyl peptidase
MTSKPLLVCLFAAALTASASAQTTAPAARAAGRPRTPTSVAISPDATNLAWTTLGPAGSELHLTVIAPLGSAQDAAWNRVLSPDTIGDVTNNAPGRCPASSPIWSPDGKRLAFLSPCIADGTTFKPATPASTQQNIFVWATTTNTMRQITHVKGSIAQPAWAPDGKSIAFLFVQNATRSAGATDAMKPWAGVIGEDGIEIQRVYGVDVASGQADWLSTYNLHVFEFNWSPDSRSIAYIAAPAPGENNWWVAKLYRQALVHDDKGRIPDGAHTPDTLEMVPVVLVDPVTSPTALKGLQFAVPRYSPDGRHIAFIGGLMSDQGSTGGDIWVVDATPARMPATPIDITPNIDGTPTWISWTGNDSVGFVEDRRGHTLLANYVVSTRKQDASTDLGEVNVSGGPIKNAIGVSTQGVLAFVKSGHATPAEIWTGQAIDLKQFTHFSPAATPPARTESLEWTSDGFSVQGWLTYPKDFDPAKKYPLIVTVHGGPSASAGARWGGSMWSALGYFEFAPNPRGSFGQGEKFVQANRKDFGYGDLRDILKGLDAVEARVPIDKSREGITGWSYGGYMTMFAVTQTHRFAAAVAGAGIADWLSYYGENSIDQWMVPFFGATVYNDPAVYAKSSPITFIKQATTPTLVIVGDRDGECPAPQSFEFWHALRDLGVKTQLVIYPNEGHHFSNPAHTLDRDEREVKWFADNMPAR